MPTFRRLSRFVRTAMEGVLPRGSKKGCSKSVSWVEEDRPFARSANKVAERRPNKGAERMKQV